VPRPRLNDASAAAKQGASRHAEDHPILVVRRQGRGGGAVLYVGLQEFDHRRDQILRRSRATTEGIGDVRDVQFGRTGAHRIERGPHFSFTPAISLFVRCETQAEVDELWEKLCEGGEPVRCGWLKDKYGLSWQIVPIVLGEMLQDKDAAKSRRVMEAMMKMIKLDIATLQQAYAGDPT
jgi:predicted 3-demethylubiquinone-9 3-methyltransferase (glyoxalase superfamily)